MGGEHDAASEDDDSRFSSDSVSGLNTGFTLDDVLWVLQRLEPGTDDPPLVLIGGQALNYWCDRYRVDNPDLDQHGPFASKDIDFQATRDMIPRCSERVGGEYVLTEAGDKSTFMNGIVTVRSTDGHELRLDFLPRAHGLSADDVIKLKAPVHYRAHGYDFRLHVMHPLHCMMSRVANVIGLHDKYANDHGMRQLKASILCLRLFIEENVAIGDERVALALNENVFKFALHNLDAEKLLRIHGIDVFDAASKADTLPERFRTIRYPQMLQELQRKRH